ncbi:Na+/H+ antiporter subunit E [Altererythrobacter lauratis]|uniref:Na+/H+ antiporter subunit E n=1 Tax=Alteraurantiacibacter lauratis TaxID=2054627 RepID=A0ABV7EAT2_9SPHN
MIARLFPHPGLSAMLAIVWVLLANTISPGTIVMACVVGLLVPLFTSPYWSGKPRLKWSWAMVDYVLVVIWDIFVANFHVAWLILFRRNRDLRSCWLVIPLDVRQPEAITVLAGTISLTPGTVSSDVSTDGRLLLVHALDVASREEEVARIKSRYEARLMRIFA